MPRILIVDDEPSVRSLLSLTFVRAGYEVRTAANADQAVDLCAAERFDAILSDVEMPGMDGHCLIQWVLAVYPKMRPVLISANSIHCEECPIVERCPLLRKPFTPKDALAAVAQALNKPAN